MNSAEEPAYFRHRARQERSRAETCADHSIARIHLDLANEYDRRASQLRPALGLAADHEATA